MIAIMLLWADGDWVKLIVPLVMFSVYALNRLFGGESPAAKQAKARQQARANPPPPPADKQRVEDEVSEFLRRAAQQRSTAGHTRTPPPKEPPRPPAPQRKSLASQAQQDDLAAAEVARAAGKPRTLAPTLSGPFDQSPLNERTLRGKEVVQAETAMQSHLSQVFDHSVGTLSGKQTDTAAVPSESPTAPAEQLAGMLRNPQNIRDAIIMSEILRRPEERW
jgi:hypothetical protein